MRTVRVGVLEDYGTWGSLAPYGLDGAEDYYACNDERRSGNALGCGELNPDATGYGYVDGDGLGEPDDFDSTFDSSITYCDRTDAGNGNGVGGPGSNSGDGGGG